MDARRERQIALGGAVLLHLLLLAVLGIELPAHQTQPMATPALEPVIQARAVSEDEVMAPQRRRQTEELERQRRTEEEQRAAEQRRQAEQERQAEVQRQQEERRKAEEEASRKVEAQQQAEAKRKAEAEAKRKAEEEAKRKAEAEAKRKAEAEAKRKAEEEAKRKAEEEAKRKAEAEAKRKAEEAALRERLAAEQRRMDEEAERLRQTQLDRLKNEYVSQIGAKVRRNWLRPEGSRGTLCTVLINQLPTGEVVGVQVTRCDGDAAFQRSVENAVYRASPLPLPADRALFARELQFNFRP